MKLAREILHFMMIFDPMLIHVLTGFTKIMRCGRIYVLYCEDSSFKSSVFICNLFGETNTWFLCTLPSTKILSRFFPFPTHCYLSGDMFQTLLVEYMIPLSGDGLSYQISIQIWHIKDFPYTVHTLKKNNIEIYSPSVHMFKSLQK